MFILCSSFVIGANCGQGLGPCACGDTLITNYTLTADINCEINNNENGLVLGGNGIMLDCGGYTINGNGTGDAIENVFNHTTIYKE